MTTITTLYAFFIRTGSLFSEVISTSTPESWISKVREEAHIPDATVVLIEPTHWNAPKLAAADADILRDAWPTIKVNAQKALLEHGLSQTVIGEITQRPVAITASPLSGLVVIIFAHTTEAADLPIHSEPATDEKLRKLVQATLARAAILDEMGKSDEAMSEFKNGFDMMPALAAEPYARALYRQGQKKEEKGDKEGALGNYSDALQIVASGSLYDEIKQRKTLLENPKPAKPEICPGCGKVVEPKWVSCPYCGTKLNEPAMLGLKHEHPLPNESKSEPESVSVGISQTSEPPKKKTWRKVILWIIVGMTVIVIAITIIMNMVYTQQRATILSNTSAAQTQNAATEAALSVAQTRDYWVSETKIVGTNQAGTATQQVQVEQQAQRTQIAQTAIQQAREVTQQFLATKWEAHGATHQAWVATDRAYKAAQQEVQDAAKEICNGKGDSRTARYVNDRTFHPLIIFASGDGDYQNFT